MQASGSTYGLDVTHDLVGSADFRELQKLAPSAIGLGRAPFKLKAKGQEQELRSTADLVKTILDLGKQGLGIQRYKGLGEMNAQQLWDTTMNPNTRTLKQVTIESAAEADLIFSMLMGDEVAPRREFIESHAKYAKLDV